MANKNVTLLLGSVLVAGGIVALALQKKTGVVENPTEKFQVTTLSQKGNTTRDLSGASIVIKDSFGTVVGNKISDFEGKAIFDLINGNYTFTGTHSIYGTKTGSFVVNNSGMIVYIKFDAPSCPSGQKWDFQNDSCMTSSLFNVAFAVDAGTNHECLIQGATVDVTGPQNGSGTSDFAGGVYFQLPAGDYNYTVTDAVYGVKTGSFSVVASDKFIVVNYVIPSCPSGQVWDCESKACVTKCNFRMIGRELNGTGIFSFLDSENPHVTSPMILTVRDMNLNLVAIEEDTNLDAIIDIQLEHGDYQLSLTCSGYGTLIDSHTHLCPDGTGRTFRLTFQGG